MKISYDPIVDAAYIQFTSTSPSQVTTQRLSEDIAIDFVDNKIIGIEILDANQYLAPKGNMQVDLENIKIGTIA